MDITSYMLGKNAGGDFDWTILGYDNTPETITDAYNIALQIKNNWTSSSRPYDINKNVIICPVVDTSEQTTWWYFAGECKRLMQVPLLNTSNVTNFGNAFNGCSSLTVVPIFDTSSATSLGSMFSGCFSLNDESLDNILQMCINATAYTGTKTLKQIGFQKNIYPVSKLETLPSYQDFIDAGWTTGY